MKLLSKKNILITGGSRGIGRGIVSSIIEQGANVAFTYSSSASLANEIVKELNSTKSKCKAYQAIKIFIPRFTKTNIIKSHSSSAIIT